MTLRACRFALHESLKLSRTAFTPLLPSLFLIACGSAGDDSAFDADEEPIAEEQSALSQSQSAEASAWPSARFAESRTAWNPHAGRLTPVKVLGLAPIWRAPLSGFSQPIVQGGQIFVATRSVRMNFVESELGNRFELPASADPRLVALDAATGTLRWTHRCPALTSAEADGFVRITVQYGLPTAAHGSVAFKCTTEAWGDSVPQNNDTIASVDAESGALKSRIEPFFDQAYSHPLLHSNGLIYVEHDDDGSGRFIGFGTNVWFSHQEYENPDELLFASDGKRLFVTGPTHRLLAFNGDHAGETWEDHALWIFDPNVTGLGVPSVYKNRVYVVASNWAFALNSKTGAQVWRRKLPDRANGTHALTAHKLYLPAISSVGSLVIAAFDRKTGKPSFRTELGPTQATGDIAVAGDVLYVGASNGRLYAIDAKDGRLLSAVDLGDGPVSSPSVAGDRVYVSTEHQVVALGVR